MTPAQLFASAPTLDGRSLPRRSASAIAGFLDRLSAAFHVARALENSEAPADRDLETLGISANWSK